MKVSVTSELNTVAAGSPVGKEVVGGRQLQRVSRSASLETSRTLDASASGEVCGYFSAGALTGSGVRIPNSVGAGSLAENLQVRTYLRLLKDPSQAAQ